MPTEPEPSRWSLPAMADLEGMDELVAIGADLEPGTLLTAYRRGLFPMPLPDELGVDVGGSQPIGWWSPNPRGIIPLDGFHTSRSLRRAMSHFDVRVDAAFEAVIRGCADPSRPHGWIDDDFIAAYTHLHKLGWAHSVEAWSKADNVLAGGLYGLAIGGLFAAESMFHVRTNGSKVAVAGLVDVLNQTDFQLLDVQWTSPHLKSLGAIDVPRADYLQMCASAVKATNTL